MEEFPVFSYGRTPNASGGWVITDINIPIFLPGHFEHYVTIMPGDFIFGDYDGVMVIPEAYVDEVLLRTEFIHEFENRERKLIADGMPIDEVYKEFGIL